MHNHSDPSLILGIVLGIPLYITSLERVNERKNVSLRVLTAPLRRVDMIHDLPIYYADTAVID